MRKRLLTCILASMLMSGATVRAEPIKLKLAYMLSDRTSLFVEMVKPFVEVELLFTEAQVADWLQRNTRDARSVTHGHR